MKRVGLALLVILVVSLAILSFADRPELYSLDEIPSVGDSSGPYDTPLKAISVARKAGAEAHLPFDKVSRNKWLVKAEHAANGQWNVEYLTAAHVPQYFCKFLLTADGQVPELTDRCRIIK